MAAQFTDLEDGTVFVLSSASREGCDPPNDRCARPITEDTRLSIELKGEVSSNPGGYYIAFVCHCSGPSIIS